MAHYARAADPGITFPFDSATVELDGSETTASVRLDLAACLADDARELPGTGSSSQTCIIHLVLTLLDGGNQVLDQSQLPPLATQPGQEVSAPPVTLGIRVDRVILSPHTATINAIGFTTPLAVSVIDKQSHVVTTQVAVSYLSLDSAVAMVDTAGKVTANSAGTARVVAKSQERSDTATITVRQIARTVTPASATLSVSLGDSVLASASAADSAGVSIPDTAAAAQLTSSDTSLAKVTTGSMWIRGVGVGTTTIHVTSGPASASIAVQVTDTLQGIHLNVTSPVAARLFYVLVDSGGLATPLAFSYPGNFARTARLSVPLPAATGYRVRVLVVDSTAIAPTTFPFVTAGIRLSGISVAAGAAAEHAAATKAITGTSTRPSSAAVGDSVVGSATLTDPSEFFVGPGLCPQALVKSTPFASATGTPFIPMCSSLSQTATTASASGVIAVPADTGTLYSITRFQRGAFTVAGASVLPIFDTPSLQRGEQLQTTHVIAAPPTASGTRIWVGGAPGAPNDWSTAANWSPAGVPTTQDTVIVNAAATHPRLTRSDTVAAIMLSSGATLDLSGYSLEVLGLSSTGQIIGSGTLRLGGGTSSLGGKVPNLTIRGSASVIVTQAVTISGSLRLEDHSGLVLDGHHVTAADFQSLGQSSVSMTKSTDTLDVSGSATFGSSLSESTKLTAGVLRIGGYLTTGPSAGSSAAPFVSSGTKLVANGTNQQVWYVSGATFQDLELANTYSGVGVYLAYAGSSGDTLTINGALLQTDGTTYLTGLTQVAGAVQLEQGTLSVQSSLRVNGPLVTASGTSLNGGGTLALLDASATNGMSGAVSVSTLALAGTSTMTISRTTTVGSTLVLGGSVDLVLGGHHLSVAAFRTEGAAVVTLASVADTLDIAGQASFGSTASEGAHLAAGVLRIGGYLTTGPSAGSSAAPFVSSGTKLVANGTNQQVWYTEGAIFHDLELRNTYSGVGVYLAYGSSGDSLRINGSLLQTAGSVNVAGPIVVKGPFTTASGTTVQGGTITLLDASGLSGIDGTVSNGTLVLAGHAQMVMTRSAVLSSPLQLRDGVDLNLNGHRVTVPSLTVSGSATVTLANAADTLDVETTATFATSASESTKLTAGVLRIGGYLLTGQSASSSAVPFVSTGTKLVANGTNQQVWYVSGATFQDLELRNTYSGVGMYLAYAGGNADTLRINGALLQAEGTTYVYGPTRVAGALQIQQGTFTIQSLLRVDGPLTTSVGTSLDGGGTLSLRHASATNGIDGAVTVNNLTLAGHEQMHLTRSLALGSNVTVADSVNLILDGHRIAVSALRTDGIGAVTLTNPGDTLDISGTATFASATSEGSKLSTGVMRIGGYMLTGQSAASSAAPFVSSGTKLIANGTNQQVWYVSGAAFHDLELANTYSGVGVYLAYGGSGDALTVGGSLSLQSGSVVITGPVTVLHDLLLLQGTTLNNNSTLTYGGTYTNEGATVTGNPPVHK